MLAHGINDGNRMTGREPPGKALDYACSWWQSNKRIFVRIEALQTRQVPSSDGKSVPRDLAKRSYDMCFRRSHVGTFGNCTHWLDQKQFSWLLATSYEGYSSARLKHIQTFWSGALGPACSHIPRYLSTWYQWWTFNIVDGALQWILCLFEADQ